jgi:hypothetical protein
MSSIEDEARPYLSKMILGNSVLISPRSQRAVAAWCALKALVGRYANTPTFPVPPDWLTHVSDLREPPKTWYVLLAKYSGARHLVHYDGPDAAIGKRGVPGPQARDNVRVEDQAVFMSLLVGQLAVKVVGLRRASRPTMRGKSSLEGFVQIWPVNVIPVLWPPRVPFDDDTFHWFVNAFQNRSSEPEIE